MADSKISQLSAGAPAVGTDVLPAQRGAGNVKLLVSDIVTYASGQLPLDGASLSANNTWTGKQTFGTLEVNHPQIAPPSSPTVGDIWNDNSQLALTAYLAGGIKESLVGCVYSAINWASGVNTTDETSLIASGSGTITMPANFFVPGKTLRATAKGYINSISGAANFKFKLGNTTVCSTGSTALPGSTNRHWGADCLITCQSKGASGKFHAQGRVAVGTTILISLTTHNIEEIFGAVNGGDAIINTTATEAFDLTVTFDTADPSNYVTCTNFILEVLN